MRIPALAMAIACLPMAAPSLADTCSDVVEDTVAELRAGATGWWSDEIAALVRASAGSACVKALSGRYTEQARADQPVAAAAAAPTESGPAPEAADDEATDDDSWNLGGLTVRSLSGSPAKKPYQRQREQDDRD